MLTKVSACLALMLFGVTFLIESEPVKAVRNTNKDQKYPDTMARRFLMSSDANLSSLSWRQRVACLTMCVPGYEVETVACCITGDNRLCINLPVGLLNNSIGSCSGWSDWGPWERCSVTCNTGIQKRHRNCSNPVPDMFGHHCDGDNMDARLCMPGHCASHCVDNTPAATCRLASSIVCQDRPHAYNANCLHYCGFC